MNAKTAKDAKGSEISESQVLEKLNQRPTPVRRIARFVANRYGACIDMRDVASKPLDSRIDFLLTRALAAHAVAVHASFTPEMAARSVVDGGQDLGVDAIAFDDARRKCWIVQSKFHYAGQGNVSWVDVLKFVEGFNALLTDSFGHANQKILAMADQIRRAAVEPGWKFVLIVASTSNNPIESHSLTEIYKRLSYQDPGNSGLFTFENFALNAVADSIEKAFEPDSIDLRIGLHNWGCVREPFLAYYGQIAVSSILEWRKFGPNLFAKNLRNFLGSSQVSESISNTLSNASQLFWYFNNGATILCESIEQVGPHSLSTSRELGYFECKGVSVVNGAQTIGSIWEQPSDGAGLEPQSMMHLRVISLLGTPSGFAKNLTRATNTQNNILARDFATMDAQQQRLAADFRLDGRKYVFRQGDAPPSETDGCTMDELATALACAHSIEMATTAYRHAGDLIDPDSQPYKAIFGTPNKPSADEAWLVVRIARACDRSLGEQKKASSNARLQQISQIGAKYILFRVLRDSLVKSLRGHAVLRDDEISRVVADATARHFTMTCNYIQEHHPTDYIQVIFRSSARLKEMDAAIAGMSIGDLPRREVQMPLKGM